MPPKIHITAETFNPEDYTKSHSQDERAMAEHKNEDEVDVADDKKEGEHPDFWVPEGKNARWPEITEKMKRQNHHLELYSESFILLLEQVWKEEKGRGDASQYEVFMRQGLNILCAMTPEMAVSIITGAIPTRQDDANWPDASRWLTLTEDEWINHMSSQGGVQYQPTIYGQYLVERQTGKGMTEKHLRSLISYLRKYAQCKPEDADFAKRIDTAVNEERDEFFSTGTMERGDFFHPANLKHNPPKDKRRPRAIVDIGYTDNTARRFLEHAKFNNSNFLMNLVESICWVFMPKYQFSRYVLCKIFHYEQAAVAEILLTRLASGMVDSGYGLSHHPPGKNNFSARLIPAASYTSYVTKVWDCTPFEEERKRQRELYNRWAQARDDEMEKKLKDAREKLAALNEEQKPIQEEVLSILDGTHPLAQEVSEMIDELERLQVDDPELDDSDVDDDERRQIEEEQLAMWTQDMDQDNSRGDMDQDDSDGSVPFPFDKRVYPDNQRPAKLPVREALTGEPMQVDEPSRRRAVGRKTESEAAKLEREKVEQLQHALWAEDVMREERAEQAGFQSAQRRVLLDPQLGTQIDDDSNWRMHGVSGGGLGAANRTEPRAYIGSSDEEIEDEVASPPQQQQRQRRAYIGDSDDDGPDVERIPPPQQQPQGQDPPASTFDSEFMSTANNPDAFRPENPWQPSRQQQHAFGLGQQPPQQHAYGLGPQPPQQQHAAYAPSRNNPPRRDGVGSGARTEPDPSRSYFRPGRRAEGNFRGPSFANPDKKSDESRGGQGGGGGGGSGGRGPA
ncbi:hypothetical protein HDK90DRAFT_511864 [Phyllosticta capitalensis]|uniref:Uncharacterized protein n=1 Tax=Phyllosticta capitalensis TaxID=121624 RepID=A0ABR1YJ88_9PEZI